MWHSRGFEKLYSVPGDLEGWTHVQSYMHPQKRPERASVSHVWLILKPCTSRKWSLSRLINWLPRPWNYVPRHRQSLIEKVGSLIFAEIRKLVLKFIWKFNESRVAKDWKRSVFIPVPKKGNPKECSNYHTIALISHASKAMLKIPQARLQQHVNCELPDIQAGFRKGRSQRSNCQYPLDRWKSKRVPEKHLFLLYWLCQSLWLCGSQ